VKRTLIDASGITPPRRVLAIGAGGAAAISGVTLQRGSAVSLEGGGVINDQGVLTLTDVPLLIIATDTVDRTETLRPQKYNTKSLIWLSVVLGTWTALFELAYLALVTARAPVYLQTSLFLFLTVLQLDHLTINGNSSLKRTESTAPAADCPSGLVTVTVAVPAMAATVERLSCK
jgi:hypothetical protein